MTRLLLLLGLLALSCPLTVLAQTPPAPAATANTHFYGKIVARDAAKKTITVFASGKTILVALDPTLRIFKVAACVVIPQASSTI